MPKTSALPPIVIDSKEAAARVEDAELIPIFELDGVTYSVPAVERADIGLEYMGQVEELGVEAAQAWMIRTTIGEAGFEALRETKGLSPDDWQGIQERIQAIVAPKARRSRG